MVKMSTCGVSNVFIALFSMIPDLIPLPYPNSTVIIRSPQPRSREAAGGIPNLV